MAEAMNRGDHCPTDATQVNSAVGMAGESLILLSKSMHPASLSPFGRISLAAAMLKILRPYVQLETAHARDVRHTMWQANNPNRGSWYESQVAGVMQMQTGYLMLILVEATQSLDALLAGIQALDLEGEMSSRRIDSSHSSGVDCGVSGISSGSCSGGVGSGTSQVPSNQDSNLSSNILQCERPDICHTSPSGKDKARNGQGLHQGSVTSRPRLTPSVVHHLLAITGFTLVQIYLWRRSWTGVRDSFWLEGWIDKVPAACSTLINMDIKNMLMRMINESSAPSNLNPQSHVDAVWGEYVQSHFHGRWSPGCCYLDCTNLSGASEAALETKLCGGCRRARYCSVACQKAAWSKGGHSMVCGTPSVLNPAT